MATYRTVASWHGEGTYFFMEVSAKVFDHQKHTQRQKRCHLAICKWLCLFRVGCHRVELVNGLIEQMGNSMTSRSDISLNNWFCLLSIQFTNMLCESWTYGIVAHTFDIRLQLKLFKFPVNYFFEEFICETSRSDGVFSHKWTSRYTNLNFSSSNMQKWN